VTVNGKPAPAVAVIAVPADSDSSAMAQRMLGRSVMFKSSSDPDGLYRITGVPAGRYRVTVFSPSHVQERDEDTGDSGKSINLSDGEAVEGIDFDLEPGAVITGTVTDQSGRPLIREFISLILIGESGKKTPWSIDSQDESMFYTDDRGVYRIYGLPPGVYIVGIGDTLAGAVDSPELGRDAPTYYPSAPRDTAEEITLRGAEEVSGIDIRHRSEPGRAISGVISSAGASARQFEFAIVRLRGLEANEFETLTYVHNSRGFVFYCVADGEYELQAWGGR
jgi:hypothetical protein